MIHFTIELYDGSCTGHDGVLEDLQDLIDYQETKSVSYEQDGKIITHNN